MASAAGRSHGRHRERQTQTYRFRAHRLRPFPREDELAHQSWTYRFHPTRSEDALCHLAGRSAPCRPCNGRPVSCALRARTHAVRALPPPMLSPRSSRTRSPCLAGSADRARGGPTQSARMERTYPREPLRHSQTRGFRGKQIFWEQKQRLHHSGPPNRCAGAGRRPLRHCSSAPWPYPPPSERQRTHLPNLSRSNQAYQ
mmetsp:Transcript_57330/g.131598  ORF Transcript_57330/g.131598 Transcript_57330/m.131598 type:complete len:200 (+) Transcript_57330:8-607(+)